MLARFGQTLFGGAAAGVITAAGLAACVATGAGTLETQRYASGSAQALAQLQGTARRSVAGYSAGLLSTATGAGKAAAQYSKAGLAQAIAQVTGRSRADACGYGQANAYATVQGAPYRQARSYPYHAAATASAQAEGYIYQFGEPGPARAYATLYGTTYYVGRGSAAAFASLGGSTLKTAGALGHAEAVTNASAYARYVLGALGAGFGEANLLGDAAVTHSDVRYFQGVGLALATAHAVVNTVEVYQAQTALAFATLRGTAQYFIGGAGHGSGIATADVNPLAATTGVTGEAQAWAHASASALFCYGGAGMAQAYANGSTGGDPRIIHTAVSGNGGAMATLAAVGKRTVTGSAAATAKALVAAQSTKLAVAKSAATAVAITTSGAVQLDVRGAYLTAEAVAQATAERTLQAAGVADATADAIGYNQINDLTRAPASRTLLIDSIPRLATVVAESRLITV